VTAPGPAPAAAPKAAAPAVKAPVASSLAVKAAAPTAPVPEPAAPVVADVPVAAPVTPAPRRVAPAAGPLDVGELRRRWKDVINQVKLSRPAASKLFLETEADIDGDTVVVEFDPSRKVLVRRAEEQDIVAALRDAIRDVLGWHVAIRYQLGRGAVRPQDDDDPPVPGLPPAPIVDAPDQTDADALGRLLMEGLGAEEVTTTPDTDRKGPQ